MNVEISRALGDSRTAKVDIDLLWNPRWDNKDGGIGKVHLNDYLYAYIPYKIGMKLLPCSGEHDFGDNDMKVLVREPRNKSDELYPRYKLLADEASKKRSEFT